MEAWKKMVILGAVFILLINGCLTSSENKLNKNDVEDETRISQFPETPQQTTPAPVSTQLTTITTTNIASSIGTTLSTRTTPTTLKAGTPKWYNRKLDTRFFPLLEIHNESVFSDIGSTLITVCQDRVCDYDTIQAAINAANNGETVKVRAGIYMENLKIDKPINLVGEGAYASMIVASNPNNHGVEIKANWVNLSGLTISGTKSPNWLYNGQKSGINLVDAQNVSIFNNRIINNTFWGISLSFSSNILIKNNIISRNTVGIYSLDHSTDSLIINNYFQDNGIGGATIASGTHTIINNTFISNGGGVSIRGSSANNIIKNNDIALNNFGITVHSSSNNTIHHNNFIDNINQAIDEGNNTWDNGNLGGNYWNDFDEVKEGCNDINGDGFCDMVYKIPEGNNNDNFPRINPLQ